MLYRVIVGKPVLFFTVSGADFVEHGASSHSAHGCLVVAIAGNRLIVRPFFPFNLMFLPEIYGLEHDVPLDRILSMEPRPGFFSHSVEITFRGSSNDTRKLALSLRNPEDFIRQLRERVPRAMTPETP